MQQNSKFLFDRDFDDLEILNEIAEQEKQIVKEKAVIVAEVEEELEEAPPTFSEEDLEAARNKAFSEGERKGVSETLGGIEKTISEVLIKINDQISELFQRQELGIEILRREAISVSLAAVEKAFPNLEREHGYAEVVETTENMLISLIKEPNITIRVKDIFAAQLGDQIQSFLDDRGFQGHVSVTGDPNLSEGDCNIQWSSGEAERSSAALLDQISSSIVNNVENTPLPGAGNTEALAPISDKTEPAGDAPIVSEKQLQVSELAEVTGEEEIAGQNTDALVEQAQFEKPPADQPEMNVAQEPDEVIMSEPLENLDETFDPVETGGRSDDDLSDSDQTPD